MLRKLSRKILVIMLAISVVGSAGLGFDTSVVYGASKTVKAKSVSLNHKVITIKKGKTVKLKATVKPKKATQKKIVWKSSKKKIATVKNGKVKGKKKGKTTITATVKGTKKKAKVTVYVGTPVKKVTFSKKSISMVAGQTKTMKAKLSPKKPTVKTIKYSSSNEDVAKVNSSGKITAVAAGTATITAKPKDEAGKSATLKVTVTDAKSTDNSGNGNSGSNSGNTPSGGSNPAPSPSPAPSPTPTPAPSPSPAPAPSETSTTVSDAAGLQKALADSNIKEITIESQSALNLSVPQGTYTDKILIVNAPQGHVENSARFKEVKIKAVSGSSYVEHAVGNQITYQASSGKVEIAENASASIDIVQGAGAINLVNDGNVSELNIAAKSNVSIRGDSLNAVPVKIEKSAAGTEITTYQELDVDAEAKIGLNIMPGAEHSQYNITAASESQASAVLPDISGLGIICIRYNDEYYRNIAAQNDGSAAAEKKVAVEGVILDAEGNAITDADIKLIRYMGEMTAEQIANAGSVYSGTTGNDGSYSVPNVGIGNYYLLAQSDGYVNGITKLIITSTNTTDTYKVSVLTLTSTADANKKGTLYGTISDAETGDPVEEDLTLMLREGGNNITGEVLETTKTTGEGTYEFSGEYPLGQYTIELVDQRKDAGSHYITISFGALIKNEGSNEVNGSASRIIDAEQVRFELRWGNEASGASADLDSHLVGPRVEGEGYFHTWYQHRVYGDGETYDEEDNYYSEDFIKYADLDRDDVDWEGPETTTIYKKSSGTYSFYIHDFTNRENYRSSQMSASAAEVKVYIGSRNVETYYVPTNKSGILWYVCDYDANRNKIITKNQILSDWAGEDEEVGLSDEDILRNAREELSRTIEDAEALAEDLSDGALKDEGLALISTAKGAAEQSDIRAIKEARNALQGWISKIENAMEIESVQATVPGEEEDEIIDLIRRWNTDSIWDEDEETLLYRVLMLEGSEESIPNTDIITVSFGNEDVSYEWLESDKEDYVYILRASFGGETRDWYVKYEQDEDYLLGISAATSIYTWTDEYEEEWSDDRITGCYYDIEYDSEEDTEGFYVLYIAGDSAYEEVLPDLHIIPEYDGAVISEIASAEKEGYDGQFTVTAGEKSRTYYIKYRLDENRLFEIRSVRADRTYTDGEGNESTENLISGWEQDEGYDSDEERFEILRIWGLEDYAEVSDLLEVNFRYSDAIISRITDSDKEGYAGQFTVTSGDKTRTYYIDYIVTSGDDPDDPDDPETPERNLHFAAGQNDRCTTAYDSSAEAFIITVFTATGDISELRYVESEDEDFGVTDASVRETESEDYDAEMLITFASGETETYYVRKCLPESVDLGPLGESYSNDFEVSNAGLLVKFTPEEDGCYNFSTESEGVDTYGVLYDNDMNYIDNGDDTEVEDSEEYDRDFSFSCNLEKDADYYLWVREYNCSSDSNAVTLNIIRTGDAEEPSYSIFDNIWFNNTDSHGNFLDGFLDNEEKTLDIYSAFDVVPNITCYAYTGEDDEELAVEVADPDMEGYLNKLILTYEPTGEQAEYHMKVTTPEVMTADAGESYDIDLVGLGRLVKFIPEESGSYTFKTTGSHDTCGKLYTEDGTSLFIDADMNGADFDFTYELDGGNTYYIWVYESMWGSELSHDNTTAQFQISHNQA